MPWKKERLRFVGRLLDGESMSDGCREFSISRKTGYKIYTGWRLAAMYSSPAKSTLSAQSSWASSWKWPWWRVHLDGLRVFYRGTDAVDGRFIPAASDRL
jgi:hypothetical protein